jgi:hypothetical protein
MRRHLFLCPARCSYYSNQFLIFFDPLCPGDHISHCICLCFLSIERSLLNLYRKEKLDRVTYHLVVRIWQLWLTPWDQKSLAQQASDLSAAEREARAAASRNTVAAAARTVTRAVSGGKLTSLHSTVTNVRQPYLFSYHFRR